MKTIGQFFNKKGSVATTLVLIIVGFVGFAGLWAFTGGFGTQAVVPSVPKLAEISANKQDCISAGYAVTEIEQQSDGTNTHQVTIRNPDSQTADYQGHEYYYTATQWGTPTASAIYANPGTAINYESTEMPPFIANGYIYGIGNGTHVGFEGRFSTCTTLDINSPGKDNEPYLAQDAGDIYVLARDSGMAIITRGTAGASSDLDFNLSENMNQSISTDPLTFATGTTRTYYIDMQINTTAGAYGTKLGGNVISVDMDTGYFSKTNGFALSSDSASHPVTKIDCTTKEINYRAAELCYTLPQVRNSDPLIRLTAKVFADINNPGAGQNITMVVDDREYFKDDDETIKLDTFSNTGTNTGNNPTIITFRPT